MNPHLRIDRVGAIFGATQTGKKMDNFLPWNKDPNSKEEAGLSLSTIEVSKAMPEGSMVDGMVVSHVRKVASKPSGVVQSKKEDARKVSASPNLKKSRVMTLEERKARLRQHGK